MKLLVVCSVCLSFVSGCAAPLLPDKWGSTGEAFPDAESMKPPKDLRDAYETALFMAPYEDVYRAALVSVSQVQFNVTYESRSKGYIFAKRFVASAPTVVMETMGGYAERRYYYAIEVTELAAKKTRVKIMAKTQGQCQGIHGLLNAMSLGINEVATDSKELCRQYSSIHWAAGFDNTSQELNQYITFVRNNLIAAGVY